MPCPSQDQLTALVDGRLPEAEQKALAEHLESCVDCRALLFELAGGDEILGAGHSVELFSTIESPALRAVMQKLRNLGLVEATKDKDQQGPEATADIDGPRDAKRGNDDKHPAETIEHNSPPVSLQALHIRCPHCHNPVELLAEAPFTDITCTACGSAFSLVDHQADTRDAPPLKTVGHFELVSQLGVGGFGTVWKAHDRELDRTVAVKIPRRGQLDPLQAEHFLREARAAAQLKHPNIVSVHEVGREGDTLYIVSDFVRGISLADWLTGQRPTFEEAAGWCATIADALHAAHQAGIVHRDLKPSNVMLDSRCNPHIMDFGLAKRDVGEITMTMDGQVLGTPAYMSPEQAKGEGHRADSRSDIYSIGSHSRRGAFG